jgi:epsilon-lactone hydrolase
MTSLQAKLGKFALRLFFRGWGKTWDASEINFVQQRATLEKRNNPTPLPAQLRPEPIQISGKPNVTAEWLHWQTSPTAPQRGVILYLHGGAYCLGSIQSSRTLIAPLAVATQCSALSVEYRLAPENPFPAALDDATAVYRWLLDNGFNPNRIILAGDSAGGGLSLATLLNLRELGLPLPAGAILRSPWLDLALTGESMQSKAGVDFVLTRGMLATCAAAYAGGKSLNDPWVSPLYADLHGLPPLLIQVGSDEILLADATRLAQRATEAGVVARLTCWEGLFHVFPVLPFLPETKESLVQAGTFVAEFVR